MGTVLVGLYLLVWSWLFALLEIATEGPVGWAFAAPTWRKRSAIYGALMSGKELTGYHIWMFVLPLFLLFGCFVFAAYWDVALWTPARAVELLACYFMLCPVWDFEWFPLNPHFGLERFRAGEIWWHQKWIGRIPQDYPGALVLVAVCGAIAAHVLGGGTAVWYRLGGVLVVLLCGAAMTTLVAPAAQQWQRRMRERFQLAEDWARWLTPVELARLVEVRTSLESARNEIARIGRLRAQREQLGVPKPA